ncbi:hypothetical protein F8279_17515 [Micromonospora sp. AMSO1212t]|uniref:Secreted protein n=1 Tax=Micromonospora tulbaghiae TaxID=479978 RepID=A0ABY0KJC2_9ACTN|nr:MULTISPECIES: hypothetical protein [Micromonospora]KAB1905521.1 hypothetical protein F8279_17515 [Micromonospora sp. AMSO1212t]MDX5461027.1 hypothetical protein [Micromonospora tulbaghiae]SCE80081.1 hypothetical protein GA0070562_2814 [Micromonospora tulbaghiae]
MNPVRQPVLAAGLTALATAATLGLAPGAAVAAPAASPRISVNWFGAADVRAHTATVGGRFDCGTERGLAYIEVHLEQRTRRGTVTGFGFGVIGACTDERTAGTWTATIPADRGAFRPGPATTIARLVVEPNSLTETTERVRLRPHCARP